MSCLPACASAAATPYVAANVWPEVDTKIPLEAAYESAVAMYAMKRGGQA